MANVQRMLTTIDNPFNPFTEFEEWFAFDTRVGYNTLPYLARVIKTSSDLSDADYDKAADDAIDEILKENILGIYRAVEKAEEI